jgi:hypothetical protein
MDFVCLCVRIPKCGSSSLSWLVETAFAGRRVFYLPHTMNEEGQFSRLQGLRFRRTRARNLIRHYRTPSLTKALGVIDRDIRNGDLISGGHIDFASVSGHIGRRLKMIVLFREPAERAFSRYEYCRWAYFKKPPLSRLDAAIVHRMAAKYDFESYLDFLLERRDAYGNVAARSIGWDGAQYLGAFFADHVFHSGVLERADVFALGLAQKMATALDFPHRNDTPGRGTRVITAAQRRKIECLHPYDFVLYEWQLAQLAHHSRHDKTAIDSRMPVEPITDAAQV